MYVHLRHLSFCSGKVNSLSVWWSGGTQLFIYSLVKTAKGMELIEHFYEGVNFSIAPHCLLAKVEESDVKI